MNESSLLLFESKWKSFLKESTNSDVNRIVDRIMNKQTPTKDRVDKKIAEIRKKKQIDKQNAPPVISVLQNNVDLINNKLTQRKVINDLNTLFQDDDLNNTPLAKQPLGKFLGAGYYSAAFEDSDGHVLKCGGIRDEESEIAFYEKHLKNPTKDFVVYYYKVFPVDNFYIAITNKFLTFFEYAEFRKSSKENVEHAYILKNAGPNTLHNVSLSLDQIRYELKREGKEITKFSLYSALTKQSSDLLFKFKQYFLKEFGLPPKESNKILEQMIQAYLVHKYPDLHLNNLGVNIVAGIDNPSFFYFDQ